MLHNHEGIKWFEKETVDHSEITSPDFVGMILKEGAPILSAGAFPDLFDVFADSPFVDQDLQLEKLAMNLFGTPSGILYGHLFNESSSFSRNTRLSTLGRRFLFPVTAKHVPMPA